MESFSEQTAGNFTQWTELDIKERKFELQNGQLKVKQPGRYFIYSQARESELACVTSLTDVPPYLTCYTAGILDLRRDDTLVLNVGLRPTWISTNGDATFWGAIKLSMDIPWTRSSRRG
ncbi:hypothetical protein Bbelb_345260 [Branchiostoma belcheri]|nr:hypothetical protein Bbelb_345260 [Branchiostoma belcheri]